MPDRGVVGRHSKRNEKSKGGHADRDIGPLDDVGHDGAHIEPLVEHRINRQVKQGITESEETDLPAIAQKIDAEAFPERGDREACDEEANAHKPNARSRVFIGSAPSSSTTPK